MHIHTLVHDYAQSDAHPHTHTLTHFHTTHIIHLHINIYLHIHRYLHMSCTCTYTHRHMKTCRFIHYEIDQSVDVHPVPDSATPASEKELVHRWE